MSFLRSVIVSAAKRLTRFTGIMILILALFGGFVPTAFSFGNGQAASLVIGQSSFTTNTPATMQNGLKFPSNIAFDSGGDLWVTESGNARTLEFVPPFTNDMSASLVIGQPDFTSSTRATTQTGLWDPLGVAFDSSGNLWIADSLNSRVLEYVRPVSGFTNGMAASLVIGQPDFTTNSFTTSQTGLDGPTTVTFDSQGNLWVADAANSRVLEFVPPFTSDMPASLVIGQSSFNTQTRVTTQTGLNVATSAMFDSAGDLWVTDRDNNRMLEYIPPFTNGMAASHVIGQPDFTTNTAVTAQNRLINPLTVTISGGNLWVAEGADNRVVEFVPPFSDGMPASLVIGQRDFTTNTPATTQNGLSHPEGKAFDSVGNLWVADGFNNRVLEFLGPGSPFDFSVLNSGPIKVDPGSSGANTITVALAGGTTQSVTISCTSGLPAGASCSFNPATTGSPTFSATLTVSTLASTPPGSYTITVTGTGGSQTHTSQFILTVRFFSMSNSGPVTLIRGLTSGSTTITATLIAGPTQPITLTVGGLPTGSSPTFSGGCVGSTSCTASPAFSTTLTIDASSSTAAGLYTITVTGTGGGETETTQFMLTINYAVYNAGAPNSR